MLGSVRSIARRAVLQQASRPAPSPIGLFRRREATMTFGASSGSSRGASTQRRSRGSGGGNLLPVALTTGILGTAGWIWLDSDEQNRNMLERYWFQFTEWADDANERSLEFFRDIGERLVPTSVQPPYLTDLKTMGYPEQVPTLVLNMNHVFMTMEHDHQKGWRVIRRPGADKFFAELQHYYEIVIYSDDVYPVAQDVITKWNLPFWTNVLHRDLCVRKKAHYIKDISKLGRKPEKMILIDHDPVGMERQPENGVLIKPFNGDPEDRELMDLLEFLKAAATEPHLPNYLKRFGGGDADIAKRFLLHKRELQDQQAKRRQLSRGLFGGLQNNSPQNMRKQM